MDIELINPIPELVISYEATIKNAISLKLITLEEWNTRFKNYRDSAGYSFIHYLDCIIGKIGVFVTNNPIMLKDRLEFQNRFKVAIVDLDEMMKMMKEEENEKKD